MKALVDQIEESIAAIPAHNPAYIQVTSTTLGDCCSRTMLRVIAQRATEVAEDFYRNSFVAQQMEKTNE